MDNPNTTGRGGISIQFYEDRNAPVSSRHDAFMAVTATAETVKILRPYVITKRYASPEASQSSSSAAKEYTTHI